MENFVFYKSFMDAVDYFGEEERKDCLYYAVKCFLGEMDPHDVPYPFGAAVIQMQASVDAAKARYKKAIENGSKGGRPPKQLDFAETDALFKELRSWKAVAEKVGVDEDTLRKFRTTWLSQNGR